MACGERYYHTFVSDDPGVWCDMNDVQGALSKLRNLRAALVLTWNRVVNHENKAGDWPWYSAWFDPLTSWMARDEFPAQFGVAESLLYDERITFDRIRDVARDGVCLLEQMVDQGESLYPQTAIDPAPDIYTPPPPNNSWFPDLGLGNLVPIAVGGIVLWLLFQTTRRAA